MAVNGAAPTEPAKGPFGDCTSVLESALSQPYERCWQKAIVYSPRKLSIWKCFKYQHNRTVATHSMWHNQTEGCACFLHSDRMMKQQPVLTGSYPSLFPQDLIPFHSTSSAAHAAVWWASELSQTKVNPAAMGWALAQTGPPACSHRAAGASPVWGQAATEGSSLWLLWTCALACSHQELPVMHLSL